jgi:hypothetical protein
MRTTQAGQPSSPSAPRPATSPPGARPRPAHTKPGQRRPSGGLAYHGAGPHDVWWLLGGSLVNCALWTRDRRSGILL